MIGERIKELRKKNRYTQKQIGAMCGVSDISVYNWERNKVEPNTDTLCRLADIFGVSVDYLLGRTTDHEIKKEAPPAMAEGEAEVSFSFPTGDEAACGAGFDSEGHAFESHRAYQTKEPPKGGFFVDLQGFFSF